MIKNQPSLSYSTYSRVHVVESGERLDSIAYRYYGNTSFWKVIANANMLSTIDGLIPGTELRIP